MKDKYLSGDFGIDFNNKKFYDLDSSELNLLGNFHYHQSVNLLFDKSKPHFCKGIFLHMLWISGDKNVGIPMFFFYAVGKDYEI